MPNFYALRQGKINVFAEELAQLCELDLPVRAILNLHGFSIEQISQAIDAALDAGVCGIQTGNGFRGPVSILEIKELSSLVKNRCKIKAVGGIKTLSHAIELIQAGAHQLGTSYGINLIQAQKIKIDFR